MASIHFASFCNLFWIIGLLDYPPKISSVCVCFPSSKNESQTKAPKDASLQQADAELLKALKDDLGNLTWWPGWPESRFTSRPRWMNRPFSRLEKHKKFSIHVIFGTMKGAFLSLLDFEPPLKASSLAHWTVPNPFWDSKVINMLSWRLEKEEDLNGFTRVIYVPTAKEKPLEVRVFVFGAIQKSMDLVVMGNYIFLGWNVWNGNFPNSIPSHGRLSLYYVATLKNTSTAKGLKIETSRCCQVLCHGLNLIQKAWIRLNNQV